MEDYFKGITTKEGARRRFVALAKKLHPDVNGEPDSDKMLLVNQQYREWLHQFDLQIRENVKPSVAVARRDNTRTPRSSAAPEPIPLSEVEDTNDSFGQILDEGVALLERLAVGLIKRGGRRLRDSLHQRLELLRAACYLLVTAVEPIFSLLQYSVYIPMIDPLRKSS